MSDDKKKKKNDKTIEEQIAERFGGAFIAPGQAGPVEPVDAIPTGSIGLDHILGIGGLPRGRIVEIYGPEASGKTTLTLHLTAQAQKMGLACAFIDAEHALDRNYAEALGVDMGKVGISQPDCGEDGLEIADMLAHSGKYGLIVIDSVAALTPKAEIEGDMGAKHVGLQARMMSQALRKMTAAAHKGNTLIVFINQLRSKIGVMFGSPETTTGGNALKYYASVRLDIRRIGKIKKGEKIVGNRTRVKLAKNKLAPPFQEVEFDIEFGKGISRSKELIELGTESGVIDKAGAWYSFAGERIGQGRERAAEWLEANPEVSEQIEALILMSLES